MTLAKHLEPQRHLQSPESHHDLCLRAPELTSPGPLLVWPVTPETNLN